MARLLILALFGVFAYLVGSAIYEKHNATEVRTYGVVTGYPSCGEYDCRLPIRWSTGKESIELLHSTRSMPVLGEVVSKVCYQYETMKTDCQVRTTGRLSPNAD